MSASATRCYRHSRTWLVSCPDCTAWHLAAELARRDAALSARAADSLTSDSPASVPQPRRLRVLAAA